MIINQFPDIQWLRKQAESNFENQMDSRAYRRNHKGWPNVILHTTSHETERNNIRGPFSLFINLSGKSIVRSENKVFHISEHTYCLTNKGQYYDLIIPAHSSTTTFNIHFGEQLFNEVSYALAQNDLYLLDHPELSHKKDFETISRTKWKDDYIRNWVNILRSYHQKHIVWPNFEEREHEMLSAFLAFIIQSDEEERSEMKAAISCKLTTKTELMRRIFLVIDCIHDAFPLSVPLGELSKVAYLSKFHLLRTFKKLKGCTPQQYLLQLRMEKANELMKTTPLSLSEIALNVGFSEISAFSRCFKRYFHTSPSFYRSLLAI